MLKKPTYEELKRKIRKLEDEVLKHIRNQRESDDDRKLVDYCHMKRTISLMKINSELNRELGVIENADKKEFEQISYKLRGRMKELKCLYKISSFRESNDFSMDGILQEIVDFIPPACQYPEITCARIIFDGYEFVTRNFLETRWKLSANIKVHYKRIGILEVCHLEKKPELEKGPFLEEEKSLIGAISEIIARLVEREWAEVEIRKCRNKIEELVKQTE